MSFFHWLTTGSSNGILLEQEKEPAISKPFLPFYSATTLQAPTFEHGCDLSRPLSWQQLADIARRANIIDEHDGKPLADKIEQSARQKITTICIDAIDDEPYVSSQINPMLFCRNQIVQSANWLASALEATDRFVAVYKNMSLTDIKIPSFIESVEVRQMSGRYPMETRAFRSLGKQTFIAGAASLLHLHRAIAALTQAKQLHDELESFYVPNMDFEKWQADSVAMSVDFYGPFIHDLENKIFVVEHSGNAACQISPLLGFEVEKQIVRIGEMEWESDGTRCDFMLDVDLIPNGSYELSCEVFARTNNGTVAGQVGAERYVEKRSWPLKINARTESEFSLRHRVNEEGLIEIFWEVDGALRAGFDHYQIEFSTIDENAHSTYITQRSDFDKCFYADKRYAGEKGVYKVYIYFKSEADRPRSLGSLDLEQAEPEVQVEYMKEDRIRLSWTYPYHSAVDVVYGGEIVAEKVTDGIAEFSLAGQEVRVVELRFSPVGDWGYKNANYSFNLENCPNI